MSNSRSWAQADVTLYSVLRQPMYIKENLEDTIERKRNILTREASAMLLNGTDQLWNVPKGKRSGGGRMRSANVRQDCKRDTSVLTPAMYEKDVEAIQDVNGINDQMGMDSLALFKHQKKLLPNRHIDKFLAGSSNPMPGVITRKMKPTRSEAQVPHNMISSRSIDAKTNVNKSVGKFPDNGGLLFKRLLSALIDENQNFELVRDEKTDPSTMQEWETDFLGSMPDDNSLLKELHLVGIYPEILPCLVEKEDDTDQDNEEPHPHKVIFPKLASEPPLPARRRSKHGKNAIPGGTSHVSNSVFDQRKGAKNSITEENKTNLESIPKSSTKRKRGRKVNHPSRDMCQKEPAIEVHQTKSKRVTQSVPNISIQDVRLASPCRSPQQLIAGDDSSKELDIIDFNGPPDDLSSMLNLDDLDDYLPQDGDDLSCLDIPMDDISTLNLSF